MAEQATQSTSIDSESVANDELVGAAAISRETGKPVWTLYKNWEKIGGIWKIGGQLHASKRELRRLHAARARAASTSK